jgi:hypothetical protein
VVCLRPVQDGGHCWKAWAVAASKTANEALPDSTGAFSGELPNAAASALQRLGSVGVLVNNASSSVVGAVEETSDDDLRAPLA